MTLKRVLALAALMLVPVPALGQLRVVVSGTAGASFDVDDRSPERGGGFSFLSGVGLRFPGVTVGAEVGQHTIGGDRKAKQYGVFVRLPAITGGRVQPYFVVGLADYRYSPAVGTRTHAIGGSVGPGLAFAIAPPHVQLLLEARFHTSFDRIGSISSQEYLGVTAGLGFSF